MRAAHSASEASETALKGELEEVRSAHKR
eukprot:COSAG02_NODE_76185_length_137_cov_26.684211_1_plen_28_part_01